jgi:hypothetical protein
MVYKFASVKRVIAKVFTDLDLKEGDHRVTDMIEWAGEAVKKIGAFPMLLTKTTGKGGQPLLALVNYQVKLPCDLTTINQVAYSTSETGPFYPMTYAAGSFDANVPNIAIPEENDTTEVVADRPVIDLAMSLYGDTYAAALTRINTYPAIREQLTALLYNSSSPLSTRDNVSLSDPYTYVVTGNYIKTNIRTGYLMISYQAVPVDDEGYPMIPDDESFEEAIYWYINMKLTYPEWKLGRVRDAVYYDAKSSWNFYRKQTYASAMMPNTDQLESIKNAWLRLVPEIDEHNTFFSNLNNRQIILNKDRV